MDRESVACVSDHGAPEYGVGGTDEERESQLYLRLDPDRRGGSFDEYTRERQILCQTSSRMGVLIVGRHLNEKSRRCPFFFDRHDRRPHPFVQYAIDLRGRSPER